MDDDEPIKGNDGLGDNDPFNALKESIGDSIAPNDLPGKKSRDEEEKAEKKRKEESAKSDLQDAESNAGGGFYKPGASAKEKEEGAGGFNFSGIGKGGKKKGLLGGKFKAAKMSAAVVVVMMLVIVAVAFLVIGGPLFMIGHLDYNLQESLGFTKTTGILQKLALRIIKNKLTAGEMPDALAGDFAEHGLMVGQVTANGDFVRTNTYIADADKLKDVAVLGHYEVTPSDGQLAILYKGKVVSAEDFVEVAENDLEMYQDTSEAIDISAKYYYSDEVNQIYKEMGLSRSLFADWEDTGDPDKNQENFEKILEDALNENYGLVMNAYDEDASSETGRVRKRDTVISRPDEGSNSPLDNVPYDSTTDVTGDSTDSTAATEESEEQSYYDKISGSTADDIIQDAAEKVRGNNATHKAAQLLNSAISAVEPYLASSVFIGIESPIQKTRIEGGPANEVMNMLNKETSITYTDVTTGEEITSKKSILTTGNFAAVVSGGKLSTTEAVNYSRDRGLVGVKVDDSSVIGDTTVAADGRDKSSVLMPVSSGEQANAQKLSILRDSVSMVMVDKNYDLMTSEVGGERTPEGGGYLSNTINQRMAAAMPSDSETIVQYNREARTEVARMAAAERATKSPFDISSPNTFMGSIVHGFANAMIQNGGSGSFVTGSVGAIANLTGNSVKGAWNSVIADGKDDNDYGETFGDYCETVKTVGVEGDIYCNSHNTFSTGYMDYTESDWKNELGDNLDESGNVRDGSNLSTFINSGMDRWATVGVKSAEACERWKKDNASEWTKIGDWFASLGNMYDACGGVFEDNDTLKKVATGEYYTLSDSNDNNGNVKKFAAFALYDTVSNLLDGSVSKVSLYRQSYYKENPVDNSRAGRVARISGMTKSDAEIALAYADYLTFIARYNPAERYAFGVDLMVEKPREPLVDYANKVAVDLYVMWHGRIEYEDLRTRTRVA